MEENKKVAEEQTAQTQKLTYEQLEQVAHQLSDQTKQLYSKLQEANMSNLFKRLDYLFKVLEYDIHFKSGFVDNCTSEIENMLTIPEPEKESEEKE